jgi:hypothetical protein
MIAPKEPFCIGITVTAVAIMLRVDIDAANRNCVIQPPPV